MSKASIVLALVTVAVVVAYVEVRMPKPVAEGPASEQVDLTPVLAGIESLRDEFAEWKEWRAGVDAWRAEAEAAATAKVREPAPLARTQPPDPKKVDPERTRRAKALLADLAAGKLSRENVNEAWSYLSGSGLESDAIAAFQAWTKKHPEDPEGWYGLGMAQTSKLMVSSSTMETMLLSAAADRAFDAALKLDDDHFGARFSKAFSYTFYPSVAGKSPEAIRQFEILVERHGREADREEMELVYQNLGREYLKVGNREKARAAFEQGLQTFPDSKALKDQLRAME